MMFLVTSCTVKNDECDIQTLILDADDFPEGVYLEQLYPSSERWAGYSVSRGFSLATDLVWQTVVSRKSPRYAEEMFAEESEIVFDKDDFRGPWETPPQVDFQSTIADNYRVACGMSIGYQCRMIATYDKYFVFFRSYISEEGIDLLTYNNLLKRIEIRMSTCVE
jgi:hypothetical protein